MEEDINSIATLFKQDEVEINRESWNHFQLACRVCDVPLPEQLRQAIDELYSLYESGELE
jgi:hypothetical protein